MTKKTHSKKSKESKKSSEHKRKSASSTNTSNKKPTSKDANKHSKSKNSKCAKVVSVPKTSSSDTSCSKTSVKLDKCRRRINQIDAEFRKKVEDESKKFEKIENELVEKIRQQFLNETEKKVKNIQTEYNNLIEKMKNELDMKQDEELAYLKMEEKDGNDATEKKRIELEKEIQVRQTEMQADIDNYQKKRISEMEEQIRRFKEQCETDIKEYNRKRVETNEMLLEQIRQKLDLEISNDKTKGKMKAEMKRDRIKEQYQIKQTEETVKHNQAMSQAIAETRQKQEIELSQAIADCKKAMSKDLEKEKARYEKELRDERNKLEKEIESMDEILKGRLKQEQRRLEQRTKMKQELLAILSMEDTRKITDEEFISTRYQFKIERSQVVMQSNVSAIYKAKHEEKECYCKVTILNKWSPRHRVDFTRYAARIMRYLSLNHSKAPYFPNVLDILSTDSKLYTFVEPLAATRTLETYLSVRLKRTSSSNNAQFPGLTKPEIINVLSQVVKGIYYLNNIFIAHANLIDENITVLIPENSDLSNCKVMITGLSRPIVFYNVESDQITSSKGFDLSNDSDMLNHLPPECFESEFQATNIDVYSIGVLAYQLVRVRSPFFGMGSSKKILTVKQNECIKFIDGKEPERDLVQLVSFMTQPQQRNRILIDEVLTHAFFKN